jgi:hypothetical protein
MVAIQQLIVGESDDGKDYQVDDDDHEDDDEDEDVNLDATENVLPSRKRATCYINRTKLF